MTTALETRQRTENETADLLIDMIEKKGTDLILYYHFESLRNELNMNHTEKVRAF